MIVHPLAALETNPAVWYDPGMPFSHAVREIELPEGRALRLVAVADTHSHPHDATAGLIALEQPDAILHAGDIGRLSVLTELEALAPTIAVRGNIDTHAGDLPDAIDVKLVAEGVTRLSLLLTHIAVIGPRLRPPARQLAREVGADVVVCGHSHVPLISSDAGIAIFNPGSIGPRRFRLPITFGVIEVDAEGVRFRHVSCETGARWRPH